MREPLRIEIDDRQVIDALNRLVQSAGNLEPAFREIGELLVETTKRRFDISRAPDGSRWPENSDVTLMRYLRARGGLSKRKTAGGGRSLTEKGAKLLGGKKPLIGETRSLSSTIGYVVSGNTLEVGSPMEYAGVQQFGAKKRQFKGVSPWGDIPARPFLGLSDDDKSEVLEIISAHLQKPYP